MSRRVVLRSLQLQYENMVRMAVIPDPEKASLIETDPHHDTVLPREDVCAKLKRYRVLILVLLLAWLGIVVCVTKSAFFLRLVPDTHLSRQPAQNHSGTCSQPATKGTPSNWTELYDNDGFAKESAERLSGAVRIPTQ